MKPDTAERRPLGERNGVHEITGQGDGNDRIPRGGVRRGNSRARPSTARVSLLVPSGRRRCWWYLATCPVCSAPHLARVRDAARVARTRRLPCGHYVRVVVARTYGGS